MKVRIATWEEAIKIGKEQNIKAEIDDNGDGYIYGINNAPDESGWGKIVSVHYSNGHYVYNGKYYPECFCALVDGDTEINILEYGDELICDRIFGHNQDEVIEIRVMKYNNKLYYLNRVFNKNDELEDVMCKEIEYNENN